MALLCFANSCVLVVVLITLKWLHFCKELELRKFPLDMLKLSFIASETAVPFPIDLAPNVRGNLKTRRFLVWVKLCWKCALVFNVSQLVFNASQHARYIDYWFGNLWTDQLWYTHYFLKLLWKKSSWFLSYCLLKYFFQANEIQAKFTNF